MVIQPCVCIAASHVGLAGLPVLAVYSSATFCIAATLFCFSFTDILSKISCLNFCGAKVQLFFDIRKYLEKNLLISLLFTVNPLCQRSISFIFKYRTIVLYLFFPLTRFIQSFTRSFVNRSSFSSPYPYRAQLLFIFCIFIHLLFISTTISRAS